MNGGNKLPVGWTVTQLSNLGKWSTGGTPSRRIKEYYQGDIPWLKISDLNDRIVTSSEECITEDALENSSAKLLPVGTICVAIYGSIGKLGILGIPAATNQACGNCIVNEDIVDKNFLFYYIMSQRSALLEKGRGGTQANLSNEILRKWSIPLPPLAEQRRIVAAVEALLARVNASRERLDRVPGLLKAFRQAVLAAAYDGRLTENWRTERQFSWSKIAIEKCGKWVGGATPSKAQDAFWVNGIIPWVTPKDMKKDFLLDSIDHITQRAVNESNIHLFPEGTVIFVVRGMILARDFPVAIINRPFTINQDIRGVIPNKHVNGHFLMYMLKHDLKKILGLVKYSTHGTKRIESPDLKSWIIPLPPLPEQYEIVRRVESLFALSDHIEQRVAIGRARADRLTQAILAKAFRGGLVPTEAELARKEGRAFEPAKILLERVKGNRREK